MLRIACSALSVFSFAISLIPTLASAEAPKMTLRGSYCVEVYKWTILGGGKARYSDKRSGETYVADYQLGDDSVTFIAPTGQQFYFLVGADGIHKPGLPPYRKC